MKSIDRLRKGNRIMEKEIIYTFTDEEMADAVYKVKNGLELEGMDILALACGAEKWIDFKEECKMDPSYQWGYGHTSY